jgi:hypothetical protein
MYSHPMQAKGLQMNPPDQPTFSTTAGKEGTLAPMSFYAPTLAPTPRTDSVPKSPNGNYRAADFRELARALETELTAAKAECERLRPHSLSSGEREDYHDALTEFARLRAEVERWQAVASEMSAEREHNANEASRLRAELATCKNAAESLVYGQRAENDRLIDDNVELTARAERADAEVAALKKLLLEFGELTYGVIDGGSIPDNLLVVHVPRLPSGYRVGQPVRVLLPAIDAAMQNEITP